MTRITRRRAGTLLGSGVVGLGVSPLADIFAPSLARAQGRARTRARAAAPYCTPFGPPEPSYPTNMAELPEPLRDEAFISLPRCFSYSVISCVGQSLSDGSPVPGGHDGMATFAAPFGGIWLVRNHELGSAGAGVVAPDHATYDPAVRGGTTTLLVDRRGRLLMHYGSLAGTERNCAGGRTPWGSWLTCEESFTTHDGVRHGYVFEVPRGGFGDPAPLDGLGRFNHEAAAVDPRTSFVYLTEDRSDSLLYRFRPAAYGDLRSPGRLEALRLRDFPEGADTRTGFRALPPGLAVDWVPIDDHDPDTDSVRAEGRSKGAALFARGEGALWARGTLYFTCTSGGDAGLGQLFAYDPRRDELTLRLESTDADQLDYPDNLALGPRRELFVCEDGGGINRVVRVTSRGEVYPFAENIYDGSEFAGVCFSPNKRLMFVNLQTVGMTLVVSGAF